MSSLSQRFVDGELHGFALASTSEKEVYSLREIEGGRTVGSLTINRIKRGDPAAYSFAEGLHPMEAAMSSATIVTE